MEKKLEVKNLQVSFRTQGGNVKAVRDISFDLYKGETLAIVGESGSGKSVTSKAIIGILAGNSIVEGGEILYDGQDLLKISEDDFHKIRGDKIAMIFQDPMSSLNPIMRVGKQLTEAMILKSKGSQKNARRDFNAKLALLNESINKVNAVDNAEAQANNKAQCDLFNSFCISSLQLENDYNEAHAHAIGAQVDAANLLFLIEKKQKVDINKELKSIKKELLASVHPYIVKEEEVQPIVLKIDELLNSNVKSFLKNKVNEFKGDSSQVVAEENVKAIFSTLKAIDSLLKEAVEREKPNFFTLGYYMMKNPESNVSGMNIKELDAMTREYLDSNFMLDFIDLAKLGVEYSHSQSIKNKLALLTTIDSMVEYFNQAELDKKDVEAKVKSISYSVKEAIDYLDVKKNSTEYSFGSALASTVNRYFDGVENNPKNQAKYDKQEVKYNKLVQAGKVPTWKLVPPRLIDLDLTRQNIIKLLTNLKKSYQKDIENSTLYDSQSATIDLIDFFKEQASRAVAKLTYKMAKARAIKLLDEVGIPEPEIRYKQYPFEFSGGMRQRIVIAIALSANPDILICDEPTTALDVTIQSQILELINKIKVERNLSVIFITHDLGVVANMADRIGVMYAGKIVEYGTSEDIFYDPRHPYTWALLSSMPDLETKEKLEAIPGTPPNMIFPPKGDAFAERNKYALEIDFELQPPLFEVSETHYAATWLLHPNAPKVNPPKIITDRIERMKKGAQ